MSPASRHTKNVRARTRTHTHTHTKPTAPLPQACARRMTRKFSNTCSKTKRYCDKDATGKKPGSPTPLRRTFGGNCIFGSCASYYASVNRQDRVTRVRSSARYVDNDPPQAPWSLIKIHIFLVSGRETAREWENHYHYDITWHHPQVSFNRNSLSPKLTACIASFKKKKKGGGGEILSKI